MSRQLTGTALFKLRMDLARAKWEVATIERLEKIGLKVSWSRGRIITMIPITIRGISPLIVHNLGSM